MLIQEDIEAIDHYLSGHATSAETYRVENLFARGHADPALNKWVLEDWDSFGTETNLNLSHLLDRVHRVIRLKEIERERSFKIRFFSIYARVAAVLLIPILLGGLWGFFMRAQTSDKQVEKGVTSTIYAPLGSRVEFTLPDGTTGFLNSGSSLTYPMPFANHRSVELQGEAWFDVVRDEQHPFEVGLGTSTVRVLGTCFNVCAYRNEPFIEIVLDKGRVEFRVNQSTPAVVLKPSERLVFNGKEMTVETTGPAKFHGWTEGKLIFRGDHMAEVARRLERWYNIDVEIADTALDDYVFRATFEDDSLQEVLRLLCMTSPIGYRITPRQALPDGTWNKEKVTLYKRK